MRIDMGETYDGKSIDVAVQSVMFSMILWGQEEMASTVRQLVVNRPILFAFEIYCYLYANHQLPV